MVVMDFWDLERLIFQVLFKHSKSGGNEILSQGVVMEGWVVLVPITLSFGYLKSKCTNITIYSM